MVAVTLAVELLLMTCIGIFTAKLKIVGETFAGQLTNFLMKIALPCLIFVSIISEPFSLEKAKACILALVAGVVVILLSFGIGQVFFLLFHKNGTGRIMRFGLTFTHFSFMGIPIVDALFGATGNLYYVMFLVPVRIFYYIMLPHMFGVPRKTDAKTTAKNILNPCLTAVFIGLIVWVFNIELPEVIMYCLTSLQKICSPLGLILCGIVIGQYDLRKLLNLKYFRLPILRTVFMPLLFFGITRLLILAGVDTLICNIAVTFTALPIPALTAMYAVQFESDPELHFEAAGSVFFATLISTITVPVWYHIITSVSG